MSGNGHLQRMSCAEAGAALPWLVNETLGGAARAALERHLDGCASCAARRVLEARIAASIRGSTQKVTPAPQAAWLRFERELEASPEAQEFLVGGGVASSVGAGEPGEDRHGSLRPALRAPRVPRARRSLLRFALAAQAITIAMLAIFILVRESLQVEPQYRTVSLPGPRFDDGLAHLRVAVGPELGAKHVGALAEHVGARVLDGPSAGRVYTLALAPSVAMAEAVARLRESPGVLLVEPIVDGALPTDAPFVDRSGAAEQRIR